MTSQEKKEYLLGYKRIYRKIQSLQDQKASLMESMRSAKAMEYSDMPKGHKQTDLSDYIVKLDKLIAEIDKKKQELEYKRLDIERCIVDLNDGTESDVLRKRYIELKSWVKICHEIGYERSHINRIHGHALKNLAITKNDIF